MDSLLAAIAAAPDDDAPRLVWADREGGERGELVVLQCRIAAREGTRADRVQWQARVRELLPTFAGEGSLVRGFAESATVDLDEVGPGLFERLPLLRELEIADFMPYVQAGSDDRPEDAWAWAADRFATACAALPAGRLTKLEVMAEIHERGDHEYPDDEHPVGDALVALIATSPAFARLRELRVIAGALTAAAIPHLMRLPLEALMGGSSFTGEAATALLDACPALRRLGLWNGSPRLAGDELAALLDAPAMRRLQELDLWANDLAEADLERIAATPFAALASLCIGMSEPTTAGLAALAASPHLAGLVDLNMYDHENTPSPAGFCRAPFALQRLRLHAVDDAIVDALVAAPALERVYIDSISPAQLDRLRAVIPLVNDGLW